MGVATTKRSPILSDTIHLNRIFENIDLGRRSRHNGNKIEPASLAALKSLILKKFSRSRNDPRSLGDTNGFDWRDVWFGATTNFDKNKLMVHDADEI